MIYLAPGSLLTAISDSTKFPNSNASGSRAFLYFNNAHNSGIFGRGVIDGNGTYFKDTAGFKVKLLEIYKSTNIKIKDVVLRNTNGWCCHPLGCNGIIIDGLKIFSDWGLDNTDGIDPNNTSNVRVARYLGYRGDDAVAVKTDNRGGVTLKSENIEFFDCVIMTKKNRTQTRQREPSRYQRCSL